MQESDKEINPIEEAKDQDTSHHHSHHHHHHHHHSHHHHRHHSHSKKTGSKNKIKYFFKKNKERLRYIAIIIVLVIALIIMALFLDSNNKYKVDSNKESIQTSKNSIQIEIPFLNDPVSIVSPAVEEYLGSSLENNARIYYEKYEENGGRADSGIPFEFKYDIKKIPEGISVQKIQISISENAQMTDAKIYNPDATSQSLLIYNLKTNTKYYYAVTFTFSNDYSTSANGSFKTAESPRMLNIDGIVNVRDIGGWKTTSGKTVRQGLLIRGSELDGAVENKFFIKKQGIDKLINDFGIRSEFDLRSPQDNKENTHPLGDKVKHTYYGAQMYTDIFEAQGSGAIKNIFSDLANQNNYPVYMHCTYGMDRTGTVCYLLGALLGVDKKDLMRDYQLSAFYYGEINNKDLNSFIVKLETYNGNTLQEKTENYLLSIGVTAQEIASIRNIFLG